MRKLNILLICLASISAESYAQGFAAPRTLESYKQEWQERIQARLGKTYAIMFGRTLCKPTDRSYKILKSPHMDEKRSYSSDSPVSVKLESIVPETSYGVYKYYKVTLNDGNLGYINTLYFSPETRTDDWTLRNGCLFEGTAEAVAAAVNELDQAQRRETERLEVERAAEQAKVEAERAAEQAKRQDLQRRPGAKIGMTAKEVVEKTSWGVPDSINKTVSQGGVAEQWVYGGRQYLYFRNGRLVSIQTSR